MEQHIPCLLSACIALPGVAPTIVCRPRGLGLNRWFTAVLWFGSPVCMSRDEVGRGKKSSTWGSLWSFMRLLPSLSCRTPQIRASPTACFPSSCFLSHKNTLTIGTLLSRDQSEIQPPTKKLNFSRAVDCGKGQPSSLPLLGSKNLRFFLKDSDQEKQKARGWCTKRGWKPIEMIIRGRRVVGYQ